MYCNLPFSLFVFLQFSLSVWASATLVPPSTFPTLSSASLTATPSTNTSLSQSASSAASSTSSAQFPSLSGYSACVSNCLSTAVARVNCSSVTDVGCYCVQPNFAAELVGCVLSGCPTEISTSETLAQQFCNIEAPSSSLSFPPIPDPTSSSSSASSSSSSLSPTNPSPTNAATSSSAAIWNVGNISQGTFIALVTTMFGVLLGAYIVQ